MQAREGVEILRQNVDTLIIIPNDKLNDEVEANTTIQEAFSLADDVLRQVGSASLILTALYLAN